MTTIRATVQNREHSHNVTLKTNDHEHTLTIPAKASGLGSSVNGGEALFLALATCYCNDLYREAEQKGIVVRSVTVEVEGEFGSVPGNIAENVVYHATVEADASPDVIERLMKHTDTVAEIQNTLRQGVNVTLQSVTAISRAD